MTSIVQQNGQIIEPLTERPGASLSCFRSEYIKGGTFYSFLGELLSKNMARKTRRQLVEIVGKAVWMIGLRWQFGSVSPFYQSDRKLLIPLVM